MEGRLTAAECAVAASITEKTWRAYVSRGLPAAHPAPKPSGYDPHTGLVVWDVAAVEAWLAARPGRGARTDLQPQA